MQSWASHPLEVNIHDFIDEPAQCPYSLLSTNLISCHQKWLTSSKLLAPRMQMQVNKTAKKNWVKRHIKSLIENQVSVLFLSIQSSAHHNISH